MQVSLGVVAVSMVYTYLGMDSKQAHELSMLAKRNTRRLFSE